MDYATTSGFDKDFTRLSKRFRTLEEDFSRLKRFAIELYHAPVPVDNRGIFKIPGYCGEGHATFKVKKFACASLKNRGAQSGLRVIYVHQSPSNITFVEIYFKQDKANHDPERIVSFLKTLKPN